VAATSNYRAYVFPWKATPSAPPAVKTSSADGQTVVYASWNGATEVASWRVLAGKDSHHLALVATRTRTGFETSISFPRTFKTYEVVALDSRGKTLGRSKQFPHHVQFGGY
jgi:hypothetical protein